MNERACLLYRNASEYKLSVNCPFVRVVPWQHPAVVMFSVVVRAAGVVKFIESTQMSIKFKNMGHCMQNNKLLQQNCNVDPGNALSIII